MNLTLGIEEELMAVNEDTGDAVVDPDQAMVETCVYAAAAPTKSSTELLRSPIETGTRVCASIARLRTSLYKT